MAKITAIFSDVGGVLGTNGWDRDSRHRAADEFRLDWEEFEDRHELLAAPLDTNQIGLDEYLDRTVFYRERSFTKQQFKDFMYRQSRPFPDSLAMVEGLAASRQYLLATLNNESAELNRYRIESFGLRNYFSVFFSSCFLGVRKPNPAIYQLALSLTQRPPEACVFIDDRPVNVESARGFGMHAIRFKDARQLAVDLAAVGVGA